MTGNKVFQGVLLIWYFLSVFCSKNGDLIWVFCASKSVLIWVFCCWSLISKSVPIWVLRLWSRSLSISKLIAGGIEGCVSDVVVLVVVLVQIVETNLNVWVGWVERWESGDPNTPWWARVTKNIRIGVALGWVRNYYLGRSKAFCWLLPRSIVVSTISSSGRGVLWVWSFRVLWREVSSGEGPSFQVSKIGGNCIRSLEKGINLGSFCKVIFPTIFPQRSIPPP